MTRSKPDDNSVLLVHAYLDGELDPANALGIAQQMDKKPALAAEGERVKALQRVIHERLPREEAPPGYAGASRRRWASARRRQRTANSSWRALAASIALTAIVASSSTWYVAESQPTTNDCRGRARLRSHSRADGTGSGRRGLIRPPHRKTVVQRPHPNLAARRRPHQGRLPPDWRPHRRGWAHACLDVGLSPCQTSFSLTAMPAEAISNWTRPRTPSTVTTSCTGPKWRKLLGNLDLDTKELEEFARLFRASPTEL